MPDTETTTTETETTETEVVETTETESKELELDDPFSKVPRYEQTTEAEEDAVAIYRRGLKEGAEMASKNATKPTETTTKKEESTNTSDDSLRKELKEATDYIRESKELQKKKEFSTMIAQNNAGARAVEYSYIAGLTETLGKVGLDVQPEHYAQLNNMMARVELEYGRPLTGAEVREVTEFHYSQLKPWIQKNGKPLTEAERKEANVGAAGKAGTATATATKTESKTPKADQARNLVTEFETKRAEGKLSQRQLWDYIDRIEKLQR